MLDSGIRPGHPSRHGTGTNAPLAVERCAWLGFIATTTTGVAVYERRPFRLLLITNGWQVISLVVMGAILGVWP